LSSGSLVRDAPKLAPCKSFSYEREGGDNNIIPLPSLIDPLPLESGSLRPPTLGLSLSAMDDSPCRIGGVEVATPLGEVEKGVEKGVDEVGKEVEKGVGDEEEERRMLNSAARRYL
jgi:hypothetical protein